MNDTTQLPRTTSDTLVHSARLFMPAVLVFLLLAAIGIWRVQNAAPPTAQATMPVSPEIEERFGVKFLGVHILAKGGLIELRYRVVDKGKAANFGHYTETSPMLIATDSGKTIEVTIMGLHNHRVEAGRVYYILYRNTENALHPGSDVTIQIDDLRLEHVIAK